MSPRSAYYELQELLAVFPSPEEMAAWFHEKLKAPDNIKREFVAAAVELYAREDFFGEHLPEYAEDGIAGAKYEKAVEAYMENFHDGANLALLDAFTNDIFRTSETFCKFLPIQKEMHGLYFKIPLVEMLPMRSATELIESLHTPYLFRLMREQLAENQKKKPSDIEGMLKGTPFLRLFTGRIPVEIPDNLRPEHGIIIARSGGGKTQLLETLVLNDLKYDNPPGIVLIDSKGGPSGMVERIAHLNVFHPEHGRLRDRLIIIDPLEKPSLNMFDVSIERVKAQAGDVIDSLKYFIGGLLGNELSGQMDTLFVPLMHLMLRVKGATLHTFAEAIGDLSPYEKEIEDIPEGPRKFLKNHFTHKKGFDPYSATRASIVTRLHQIINEERLDQMFSAPKNAIDISLAINEGKIILISTAGLGDLGPLFGRYFISRLLSAAKERYPILEKDRKRVHLYVDEAEQFLDPKLKEIFTTLRSFNVGAILAFQDSSQLGAYTNTIRTSTAIKLLGNVTIDDAKPFASGMHVDIDFIASQKKDQSVPPKWTKFALYHEGISRAVSITVPLGNLDAEDQMDEPSYQRLRAQNRARLTVERPKEPPRPAEPPRATEPPQEPPAAAQEPPKAAPPPPPKPEPPKPPPPQPPRTRPKKKP